MKHCNKCGTFYSSSLECCPKCSVQKEDTNPKPASDAPENEKSKKRNWIAILIGIPALILFYYLIIGLLRKLVS